MRSHLHFLLIVLILPLACAREDAESPAGSLANEQSPSATGAAAQPTATPEPSDSAEPEYDVPLEPSIYVFHCDGFDFIVHYEGMPPEAVTVNFDGRSVRLPAQRLEAPAIYTNGEITFRETPDSASLQLDGKTYENCTREPAANVWHAAKLTGVDFRALGQEPGWLLDIDRGNRIVMEADYGTRRIAFPYAEPSTDPQTGSVTYRTETADHTLEVLIEDEVCHDVMSGHRFEYTVTVHLDGDTYHGCGREL